MQAFWSGIAKHVVNYPKEGTATWANGWFVDLNYASHDFNEPYYTWHQFDEGERIFKTDDAFSDTPSPHAFTANEYNEFIVGAYDEQCHKFVGFVQWGAGYENGNAYPMYLPKGLTTMPQYFEEALASYWWQESTPMSPFQWSRYDK